TELLRQHGAAWSEGLPAQVRWRSGFPEVFEVGVREYPRYAAMIDRHSPVQSIRLSDNDLNPPPGEEDASDEEDDSDEEVCDAEVADYARLASCPSLEHWIELEMVGGLAGESGDVDEREKLSALMVSPHLTQLRCLVARDTEFGPWVDLLIDPRFAQ